MTRDGFYCRSLRKFDTYTSWPAAKNIHIRVNLMTLFDGKCGAILIKGLKNGFCRK